MKNKSVETYLSSISESSADVMRYALIRVAICLSFSKDIHTFNWKGVNDEDIEVALRKRGYNQQTIKQSIAAVRGVKRCE